MIPEIVGAKGVGQSVDDPDRRYEDRRSFDVPGDRQKISAAGTITSARSGLSRNCSMRCSGSSGLSRLYSFGASLPATVRRIFPGQAVQFIDIAARTDDLQAGIRIAERVHIAAQRLPALFPDLPAEHTHRADIVRTGAMQLAVVNQAHFGAAAPHIDINVTPFAFEQVADMAVVNDPRLFHTVDNFDADAGFA